MVSRPKLVIGTVDVQLCGVSVSRLVSVSQRIPPWLSNRLKVPLRPHHADLLLVPLGPWTSPTPRQIHTLHLRVCVWMCVRGGERSSQCTPVCCCAAHVKKMCA